MTTVVADPEKYGLYQEDGDALTEKQKDWSPAYDAATKAKQDAHAAVQAKAVAQVRIARALT